LFKNANSRWNNNV